MSKTSIVLAIAALSHGCADVCSNKTISAVWSPNGLKQAAVFERNCGATTSYSYHIAVIEKGDDPLPAGNVLVLDDDHGAATDPVPSLRWLNQTALEVAYPVGARIFEKKNEARNILIKYRERQ